MKCWFITGVSRGLGMAIAQAALDQGDKVVGTVRNSIPSLQFKEGQLHVINVDMDNDENVIQAVQEAFEVSGRIDVIVNNAGYGVLGAFETSSDDDLHKLFQVNVFSPLRIIRTALPYLRAQGGGHIINLSSIAGRAPGVGSVLYATTKFAIEGLSASLAREVEPFNIKITSVAPGQFRTDFLNGATVNNAVGDGQSYSSTVGSALDSLLKSNQQQLGDPQQAARVILTVADVAEPPLHLVLGSDAFQRAQDKLRAIESEMLDWKQLSLSTDFDRD